MRKSIALLLTMGLTLAFATAKADDGPSMPRCCDGCGGAAVCLQKVCERVCEMKKETRTCWCVEYQEFGTLLPGCPCHHDDDCCCPPSPKCGRVKCVKKLVKKEYQVEVPVYRIVVRYLCTDCCNGEMGHRANPPGAGATVPARPVPPPPPAALGRPAAPRPEQLPPPPSVPKGSSSLRD
jgi:hypothetical protein